MMRTIMYNDYVDLEIDEKGVLCAVKNYGKACDVTIPHKLFSGEIITAIGTTFLYGDYKDIQQNNRNSRGGFSICFG